MRLPARVPPAAISDIRYILLDRRVHENWRSPVRAATLSARPLTARARRRVECFPSVARALGCGVGKTAEPPVPETAQQSSGSPPREQCFAFPDRRGI